MEFRGWDIEHSISDIEPPLSRTQPNEKIKFIQLKARVSPLYQSPYSRSPVTKSPNRSPVSSIHEHVRFMPRLQQPLNCTRLKLNLNDYYVKHNRVQPYSQNQLSSVQQLKRKNQFLQQNLKKIKVRDELRHKSQQNIYFKLHGPNQLVQPKILNIERIDKSNYHYVRIKKVQQ